MHDPTSEKKVILRNTNQNMSVIMIMQTGAVKRRILVIISSSLRPLGFPQTPVGLQEYSIKFKYLM